MFRILHVANAEPTPDSGASGTDLAGVDALRSVGHLVTALWANDLPRRIRHHNLHYVFELPRVIETVVADYLSREQFDIVQVTQPHGFLAARLLASRFPNVRFVHRSHGFEPLVHAVMQTVPDQNVAPPRAPWRRAGSAVLNALLHRNYRGICRYADGHLVSAAPCKHYLADVCGVPTNRIAAVPQGIPAEFVEGASAVNAGRLARVLHVGQFAPVKAPRVLVATVTELLRRDASLEFTWVCARQHHELARSLFHPREHQRVAFKDWMPQEALRSVYDSHGLFLFPSYFEGFGKVFLEAMSRGLVVVASDVGGMQSVIRSGIDGVTVPPGNADEFVEAASHLLASPSIAFAMSKAAIESARRLDWIRFATDCTDFYARLMAMPKRSET